MSAEYIQWLVYDLKKNAEHRTVDRCKSLRAACATNKESKAMCKSFLETHGFHEEAAKCLVGNGAENLAKDVMVRWKLTMQNTEDEETGEGEEAAIPRELSGTEAAFCPICCGHLWFIGGGGESLQ